MAVDTCPECGQEYILRQTVTFSTERPAREQYVHEVEEGTEIDFYADYCLGEVANND